MLPVNSISSNHPYDQHIFQDQRFYVYIYNINWVLFLVLWGPVALGHQLDHEVWKPSYPKAHRVMPAKVRGRKPKGLDFLGVLHPVWLANAM